MVMSDSSIVRRNRHRRTRLYSGQDSCFFWRAAMSSTVGVSPMVSSQETALGSTLVPLPFLPSAVQLKTRNPAVACRSVLRCCAPH